MGQYKTAHIGGVGKNREGIEENGGRAGIFPIVISVTMLSGVGYPAGQVIPDERPRRKIITENE